MIERNFLSWLGCITIAVCVASCDPYARKCPGEGADKTPTVHKLSDDEIRKIPYKGKDTLIFISDAGDTAILYGQGKKHYMDALRGAVPTFDPDCPDYISKDLEKIEFAFQGTNNNLKQISLTYTSDYKYPSSNDLIVNANESYMYLGLAALNYEGGYKDSVMIRGRIFTGRNLMDYDDEKFEYDSSLTVLYNYHYGILRLSFLDGNIWTLDIR